jgi:hypothetical protein
MLNCHDFVFSCLDTSRASDMPKQSKWLQSKRANAAFARSTQIEHNDTKSVEVDETSMEVNSMIDVIPSQSQPTCSGFDHTSSTREIYENLQREVRKRKQSQENEVYGEEKESRKRQRYSGSLKAYDNMSDVDIFQECHKLNRTGSKMYTKEVNTLVMHSHATPIFKIRN